MLADQIFSAYEAESLRPRQVSDTALREYRITTSAFLTFLRTQGIDAEDVRHATVMQFFAGSGWAATTQHARLTWLRSAWRYAYNQLDLLTKNRLEGQIHLERARKAPIRTIPNAVLRQAKADCGNSVDYAAFCLFAYTGMRRAEVAGLLWTGVSFGEGSLTFVRKGGDTATIPMHPAVAKALKGIGVFRDGSPWVIHGQGGGRMSSGGLDKMVHRFLPRPYTPHDFRHTVASSLEHNDAREAAIYGILGWSPDGSLRLKHYTAMPMHVLYREVCKLYADDPV